MVAVLSFLMFGGGGKGGCDGVCDYYEVRRGWSLCVVQGGGEGHGGWEGVCGGAQNMPEGWELERWGVVRGGWKIRTGGLLGDTVIGSRFIFLLPSRAINLCSKHSFGPGSVAFGHARETKCTCHLFDFPSVATKLHAKNSSQNAFLQAINLVVKIAEMVL